MTSDLSSKPLGFKAIFIEALSWLETDHGFSLVKVRENHLLYESDKVVCSLYHSSFEIEFDFILKPGLENGSHSLYGSLEGLAPDRPIDDRGQFAAGTDENLKYCAEKISFLLCKYCMNLLAGDKSEFSIIEKKSLKKSEELSYHFMFHLSLSRAEEAWKNKDFAGVVSAYDEITKKLSLKDQRRYDYSKKKLGKWRKFKLSIAMFKIVK